MIICSVILHLQLHIRVPPIYKTSDDRISVDSRFREVSQRNYTSQQYYRNQ